MIILQFAAALYFVSFNFLANFVVLTLVLSVVIDTVTILSEEMEERKALKAGTAGQQEAPSLDVDDFGSVVKDGVRHDEDGDDIDEDDDEDGYRERQMKSIAEEDEEESSPRSSLSSRSQSIRRTPVATSDHAGPNEQKRSFVLVPRVARSISVVGLPQKSEGLFSVRKEASGAGAITSMCIDADAGGGGDLVDEIMKSPSLRKSKKP